MKNILFLTFLFISILYCNAALPTPGLTSPTNGAINSTPDVLLDWTSSSGQTGYEYRYGLTISLSSATIFTSSSSQINLSNLFFGATYYWQVRAVKITSPIDSSNWSQTFSFTTTNQLNLVAPINGATNQSPDVLIDWGSLSGISNYDYQWDTTATFTSPLSNYGSTAIGFSQISTSILRFGTKYYWRARARHAVDTTLWSQTFSFTTTNQLNLVAPINGATNQSPDVLIDWGSLSGISNYDYQWDTTATFTSLLSNYGSTAIGFSQISTSTLRFGTKYYWRARARHAVDTTLWSQTFSFTTTNQLNLVAPINGATNQSPDVLIDWGSLSGISNYDYQWDTTATFTSPLSNYGSTAIGFSQISTSTLRFGTKYYWRARARHAVDTTLWSQTFSFTTTNQLNLVAPINGATNQSPDVLIDWGSLSGISNYDYQWDTAATFTSPLSNYDSTAIGFSQISTSTLRFGTKYYWRARARHAVDTTLWSQTFSFTTTNQLNLVAPINGATNQSPNVLIDWGSLSGITNYQYQVDTLSNFSSPFDQTINSSSSQVNLTGLLNGRTYYWRVRASHSIDTTNWSLVRAFTVGIPTGLTDINNTAGMQVYPNPFAIETTLTTKDYLKNATLIIYNVSGQHIKQIKNISGNTVVLSRDNLPRGLYFIRLTQDSTVIATNILVITD